MFDYQIILDCIAVILTVCAFYVWNKWVKPWLYEHHLYETAQIAVQAAEAMYGRYNGQQKFNSVLQYLAEKGYDVDAAQVIGAVQAAWKRLDLLQQQAGEKTAQIVQAEE